ncbi:M1 family peptidase [Novosphingobium sp. Gsoil 351]|nr:M1 family peptidase [Novosphingobium sp. Gsoil 351]
MLTPVASAQPATPPQPLAKSVPSDLPRTARPLHYAIAIEPDAANLTFAGQSSAEIEVFAETSELLLHAVDLKIAEARLVPAAGGVAIPLKIALDEGNQLARFAAPSPITPGRYTLTTRYSGTIYTQANGLFALDYNDTATGQPRRGLFTQFEAPDARRFAPLFDEPSYKATFDLSAIVPAAQMAVSNMPVAREEQLSGGRKRVTFATSPKMSSYLLFFGTGDFERIARKASNGTEVGVVVPRGKIPQGGYALDSLAELVPYYSDYFAQPYPLPKLDEVTGPGQSQFFGAMENWGAIFTFEYFLLNDPALTSAAGKQNIYTGVAHETAHQWFGDLVTMAWWDDLWLNEGFASWMETKASDHFNPSWNALLDRVGGREAAMGQDGFVTTHPIVQKIRTVEETNQAFDSITYSKGEAVISMLEAYAGPDIWRSGLRAYMKDRAYGNATTQDLWHAVEAAGAPGLTAIASDFTNQPGIPLVRVAEARCVGGHTRLVLEQSQFSRDRKADVAAQPLRWRVPLLLTPRGGKPTRIVLKDGRAEATVASCAPVVVNGGQLGYFRTLYPAPTLAGLTKNLSRLAPIDQLGLVKDNLALSRASYQPMTPALDLLAAVPVKGDATVAAGAVDEWGKLYDSLAAEPAEQARLGARIARQWRPRMVALGFEPRTGETLPQAQLRAGLIAMLGKQGDPAVVAEARRRFARLPADPRALDGPLKTEWLRIVAGNATRAEWDALAALAKSSPALVERSTYFGLLGRASDPALAQATLDLALTDTPPPTVRAAMVRAVAEGHADLAFGYAMAHRAQIEALVDDSSQASYFAGLASTAQDPTTLTALQAYGAGLKPDQRKPVARVLGQIRQRLADTAAQVAGTKAWLAGKR